MRFSFSSKIVRKRRISSVSVLSSWLWAQRDENGEAVEGGCKTDLPIARIEPETPTHENPRLSDGDYTPYFDDVMLDRMINEWFEEQALEPAA